MAKPGETIQYPDGRVELKPEAFAEISASPLFNRDLAPVRVSDRNWTTYNYAALWISMAHCIPTYMLSSGLISAGMNWWQALITILLGNTIVLVPILLNSHPGTKYGIPFPVFARAAYGTYGSNLPALMRAIVACGWFGINAWIGGEALYVFFGAIIPKWPTLLGGWPFLGYGPTRWISFLLFWALNLAIIYRGMNLLRKVENWAAPFVLIMTALLLGWAIWKAHGLGFILQTPGKFAGWSDFRPVFFLKLTAMIGFWATLSLNMPDFTRFGHSQRQQAVGQIVALPTTMTVFAAMSIIITSAAMLIYRDLPAEQIQQLWDPMKLASHFSQVWVIAISMFTVVVATLAVNIAANVVSPANDFANAFPRWISFSTGGLITGIIGILIQPWRLLENPARYIDGWLVGYSGGMGAIAAVLITDYWLVRRKDLALGDLYRRHGTYTFNAGWNLRAVIATLLGCALAWSGPISNQLGMSIGFFDKLYSYAWFVGFGVAGGTYFLLMKLAPPRTTTEIEST
jgi:NCS1 family nucleobase:cation symporter-1